MEKLAIVILNWNGRKMLDQYLSSVLQYSKDEATVYVADNASTDDSLKMLRETFPAVKLIELDQNWGFAEGYNRALKQIEAEYYLLLNSDIMYINFIQNQRNVEFIMTILLHIR